MDSYFIPSTWRRLFAHGIDQFLQLFFYLPFSKILFLLIFTDDDVRVSLFQLALFFMMPVFYEFFFLVMMQATPGKWLTGLRVVPNSDCAGSLNWRHCILRPLTGRLTFFFSWAVYALAFFRYDRTHLPDWVAETRVVQLSPRLRAATLRPIVGTILVLLYAFEGLASARGILSSIDWIQGEVELRSLIDLVFLENLVNEVDE